jgi:DNA-binding response OmpR family regulator
MCTAILYETNLVTTCRSASAWQALKTPLISFRHPCILNHLMRVLIADDHFLFRGLLTRSLNALGIRDVTVVADGAAAHQAIVASLQPRAPFDLVFLDWEMPGPSGLDLTTMLRSQRLYDATPVCMLTAQRDPANAMAALRLRVTLYIMKPISVTDLQERVGVALKLAREGFRYVDRRPIRTHQKHAPAPSPPALRYAARLQTWRCSSTT